MFRGNRLPLICDTHMDPIPQPPDGNLNTLSNRRVFDCIFQEVYDSARQPLSVPHQGWNSRSHLKMQRDISSFCKNLNKVCSLLNHLAEIYSRYGNMELACFMPIDIKQIIYHGKEKFTRIPCRCH